MSDVERRIRDALAEVDGQDPAPGFRQVWSRAEGEARKRAARSRVGRLVLVPMLGAVAAAAVVAVLAPGAAPPGGPLARAAAAPGGLESLSPPELPSLPSDDLGGVVVGAEDVDGELLLAWNEKMLGSQTDWLLTLELPAWDRGEERNDP